tara:strand:- start:2337 stop:2567 length:231 start_codon:yes stop_codon:yes gene_type:complete
MNIGDLVKLKSRRTSLAPVRIGLIIDLVEKKCWRTDERGRQVNWNIVEPEPHAVVSINGNTLTIPITDLVAVNEGR